jgi:hypothetical protein
VGYTFRGVLAEPDRLSDLLVVGALSQCAAVGGDVQRAEELGTLPLFLSDRVHCDSPFGSKW